MDPKVESRSSGQCSVTHVAQFSMFPMVSLHVIAKEGRRFRSLDDTVIHLLVRSWRLQWEVFYKMHVVLFTLPW